jgi:tRNA threonylcarbamoyladenosine biosynthesis protein TsaB
MILLAIDTSGKQGSIALARVDKTESAPDRVEILEVVPLEGGTFSAQLIPQVSALLSRHGFSKSDLGAFAVASGPGSFTGLRVGLAAIKALAEVLRQPIVAVSLLEALARNSSQRDVIAVLDAGRGEVYIGEYEVAVRVVPRGERLISRKELFDGTFSAMVTSDPGVAEAAHTAGLPVELVDYPGSVAVARIGWEKLRSGETISPSELEANYIRRSDAEIFAKQK